MKNTSFKQVSFSEFLKFKPELKFWPKEEAEEYVERVNLHNKYFTPVWKELKELAQNFYKSTLDERVQTVS